MEINNRKQGNIKLIENKFSRFDNDILVTTFIVGLQQSTPGGVISAAKKVMMRNSVMGTQEKELITPLLS